MTEKKRMSREDRRDVILSQATAIFGRLGYHNATTSELAKAAGVSEALLYQHFPSKQALLIACIDSFGDRVYDGLQAILSGDELDPQETAQSLFAQLGTLLGTKPEINRFGLVILAELEDKKIRAATRKMIERNVELLTRALKRGQDRGVLRSDVRPELISWLLVGMYQLYSLAQRLGVLDQVDAQAMRELVRPFVTQKDLA